MIAASRSREQLAAISQSGSAGLRPDIVRTSLQRSNFLVEHVLLKRGQKLT